MLDILLWGAVTGLIHFCVLGAAYGNPFVDRYYSEAQKNHPGVKAWASKPMYMISMFLGTQVEVYILAFAFAWLRPLVGVEGLAGAALLALVFSGIRVYPRSWNMWIQSTYPTRLIVIETINGVISTFVVVLCLHWLLPV